MLNKARLKHIVMEGYISIKQISEDLAEHPMLRDISFDRIINYAQMLIKTVGSPKLFLEKTAIVPIKNYRGELPCDFVEILQVRGVNGEEYVSSMNSFHNSPNKQEFIGTATYRIQGDVIITSREDCDVEIAYRAIPVDEDGWPMFPDNAAFINALEAYIKMKRFNIYFDMGQINQNVFVNAQREYNWYVGQAQSELILPSYDEMETITNVWNNWVVRTTAHRSGFALEHNKEYIRKH